jgi:Domain of unknown function (DUF2470)
VIWFTDFPESFRKALQELGQIGFPVLREDYQLQPEMVVRTLLARADEKPDGLVVAQGHGTTVISTRSGGDSPLFRLSRSLTAPELRLRTPFGNFDLASEGVEDVGPDPLWKDAHGICAHMETDHSNTFQEFLRALGYRACNSTEVSMPWVERRGFFLTTRGESEVEHVWVAFPQPCDTPNDVRKSLIKMLQEFRP